MQCSVLSLFSSLSILGIQTRAILGNDLQKLCGFFIEFLKYVCLRVIY